MTTPEKPPVFPSRAQPKGEWRPQTRTDFVLNCLVAAVFFGIPLVVMIYLGYSEFMRKDAFERTLIVGVLAAGACLVLGWYIGRNERGR